MQRLLNFDDEVKRNVGKRKMSIKMYTERKKRKPGKFSITFYCTRIVHIVV